MVLFFAVEQKVFIATKIVKKKEYHAQMKKNIPISAIFLYNMSLFQYFFLYLQKISKSIFSLTVFFVR